MTVVVKASISLDGYSAGPEVTMAEAMGRGGERLHEWLFAAEDDPVDAEAKARMTARVGATVLGRRTYDLGIGHWGDVPYPGEAFVLTHRPGQPVPMASGTFHFVGGIAEAVAAAREAADGREVTVMGADTARQALAAGLVDELELQVVPLLLGSGTRLLDGTSCDLEQLSVTASARVTHVRYRVLN